MIRIKLKFILYLVIIGSAFSVNGCISAGEKYTKLVKTELAKGQKVDSLFLGISFGMTSKAFFGHCWELNKKSVISDGANNTLVLYKIDSALKFPASMNFYPDFYMDKIFNMRASFQYNAWAIWNKAQSSDNLFPDVVKLYKKWYPDGNDFLKITDKSNRTIYIKVDGNRRITIGKYDDMIVKVEYTDLLIEQKLKK